jgi:hypothetical protein
VKKEAPGLKLDIITTATASEGTRTPIEKARKGERYTGIAHHEDCLLFPVHRRERSSSFAHMPNRKDCRPPGESDEHRQVKEAWRDFLWLELTTARFWSRSPMFGDITWTCRECLRPHVFELLDQATDVVVERRLANGLRPDITIVGPGGAPLVVIEFKKTTLSAEVNAFVKAKGIPLFVVNVLDGVNEQASLHNRQRQWYDDNPDFDEESREMARMVEAFPQTTFVPVHDANGNLADAFLTYPDKESDQVLSLIGMPSPRRGHMLFAHDSTLGCESQRQDRMPWLYAGRRAS